MATLWPNFILIPKTYDHSTTRLIVSYYIAISSLVCFYFVTNSFTIYNLLHQSTTSIYPPLISSLILPYYDLLPLTIISMSDQRHNYNYCCYLLSKYITAAESASLLFIKQKPTVRAESTTCLFFHLLSSSRYINIDIYTSRSYVIHPSSVFMNTMYTTNCVYKLISQLLLVCFMSRCILHLTIDDTPLQRYSNCNTLSLRLKGCAGAELPL